MKKLLIAAAALMSGTAVIAQTAPVAPPPAAPAPVPHPMADRVMTRAEVMAMVRDHFARLDANKDGSITTAEVAEHRTEWAEHRKEMGGAPGALRHGGDPNAAFDRLDTNKDGAISRDEFAKGRQERIERRVEIHEKRKEGAEDGKEARGMRLHRMGGFGGRMIVMADTNKDGRITLAEAETMALQHFDQMDTNRDGQVTPEERRAARPMMIKQFQAPSAG